MAGKDLTEFSESEANLAQFMIDNMKKYGSEVALVDAETEISYTYPEVIDRIQRLAAGLRDLGLQSGDVVCLFTYNNIDYPVIMYATNLLGGTLQTMSPLYKDNDVIRRFLDCKPKFLVTSLDQASRAAHLVRSCKSSECSDHALLSKLIVMGKYDGFIEYDAVFGTARVTESADVDPKTTAAIYLSSGGTTGPSKSIQLTHTNIAANMPQMLHVYRHCPGMCTVGFLGMFHHYGNCGVMSTCLYSGVKLVVMRQLEIEKYIRLIEKYKADILHITPVVAVDLVKSPLRSSADLSSVKFIHSAAGPLGVELTKELMAMFNLSFISQLYGLTETGLITGCYKDAFKIGSSGVVTIGTELKIANINTGDRQPANITGEVLCKGPQVTIGYLNRPEATEAAFDKDGFFKTGDTGYMDDDGFLFVVDRVKDLIKYNNHQVPPAQLEDMLLKHADITDAAVIGIPGGESGEIPKAFVVRRHESTVTELDIIKYIQDQVEDHLRLRGGVEFIDQIPKSPAGKRLRRLLKQYGANAVEHI